MLAATGALLFGSPVLGTNGTWPGIRPAATILGYPGPTNMAFTTLLGARALPGPAFPAIGIAPLRAGWNRLALAQVALMAQLWSVATNAQAPAVTAA